MVVLHTGLLVGALVEAWVVRPDVPGALAWSMLALVVLSQALRWWCIATLGRRWNTRVIVVPGLAPVRSGPYRWLTHPNYVAVVVEGVALPLVHAAWITAAVFTVANAVLLRVRIRVENAALASLPAPGGQHVRCVTCSSPAAARSAWRPRLYAARAGLDVVVREPRDGPIDKACGEGLMPGAVADLTDLGVPLHGRPITGIRYVAERHQVSAAFRSGPGRGVRRTTLHDALADRRHGGGCRSWSAGAVDSVGAPSAATCWSTASRPATSSPPTGCTPPSAGCSDSTAPSPAAAATGCAATSRSAPWTSYVEVHWARDAEAYVTPVGDDQVGVALLTDRAASFDELLEGFPLLRERLTGQRVQGARCRTAAPAHQRRASAGRVLLVGDAAGYVDALTGEGIALGLAQARAAVAAIAPGRPERLRAGRPTARLAARPAHPRTARPATAYARRQEPHRAARAAGRPGVFSAAVNQLARPVGVHDVLRRRRGGAPRRGRPRDRHGRQARRAPPRHPAAPGVLLLPLRRAPAGCC